MGMRMASPDSLGMGVMDQINFEREIQTNGELTRFLTDLSYGPEYLNVCDVSPFFLVSVLEEYANGKCSLRSQASMNYNELSGRLDDVIFFIQIFLDAHTFPSQQDLCDGEDLLELYYARNIDIELDMRLSVLYALLERAHRVSRYLLKLPAEIGKKSTGVVFGGVRAWIANTFQDSS